MKKHIINLTSHDINLVTKNGNVVLHPGGIVSRISQKFITFETVDIDGVEVMVNTSELQEVVNLPEEKENVFYIVSFPTVLSCPQRQDLLFPNGLIRNEKEETIGCSFLSRLKK